MICIEPWVAWSLVAAPIIGTLIFLLIDRCA